MKPMIINAFQYWYRSEILVDWSPRSSLFLVSLPFRADPCGSFDFKPEFVSSSCCQLVSASSCSEELVQFAKNSYSQHSFGFSPCGFFPWNFVFMGYLLHVVFPDQSLLWSCCCQHSLCFLLVPKDGSGSAACDRMVVFPDLTIADNIFSDTFSFRNAWFQLAF